MNMNKQRIFFLSIAVAFALLVADTVLAAGKPVTEIVDIACNKRLGGCGFDELIAMLQKGIDFLIYLSPFVAAIGFGIAGFYYITDQGSGKNKEKAHEIFYWTLIGFLVILAAWLIVRTILAGLGVEGKFNFVKP